MAAVSYASIGITDHVGGKGHSKRVLLFMPAATSAADLATTAQDLAANLDPVIDGKITDITITTNVALPGGLKSAPVAGNTVHEGVNLNFDVTGSNYTYTVYVPSISETYMAGDSFIEGEAPDAGAVLVATFVSGAAGVTPDPSDEQGNDIAAFLSGYRTFRK